MTFINWNVKDNAEAQLQTSITSTATTIVVKPGQVDKLPTVPCVLTLNERIDNSIVKFEKVRVTDITGDNLTVERGYGDTIPLAFSNDEYISCFVTEDVIDDIQDELVRLETDKANDDEVVHLTGDETIAGVKTFNDSPLVPVPTTDLQATNKQYVDNTTLAAASPSALYEKGLIAGENLDTNESLFVEKGPTYAEATLTQNIGDVTDNTRVATRQISKGGDLTDFTIAVDKVGSPSTSLIIDLYTDLTGSPIGTATILNTTVTGSKQDLTVSRDSAFTYPDAGVEVFYVLRQTADTVNGSNYYRIYYNGNHTSTRFGYKYNGNWENVENSNPHGVVLDASFSDAIPRGLVITSQYNQTIVSVEKDTLSTATRCRIFLTDNTVIATATYIGDVATFSTPIDITKDTTYYILDDNDGSTYTYRRKTSVAIPIISSTITYIEGGRFASGNVQLQGTTFFEIIKINTVTDNIIVNNMTYITSSNIQDTLLSKTSALYTYKLPTDYPRLATQDYTSGQEVTSIYHGLAPYEGLVDNTVYFVADTPGAISAVQGSYNYAVGKCIGDDLFVSDSEIFGFVPPRNVNTPGIAFETFTSYYNGSLNIFSTLSSGITGVSLRVKVNGNIVYSSGGVSGTPTLYSGTFRVNSGDIITLESVGPSALTISNLSIIK